MSLIALTRVTKTFFMGDTRVRALDEVSLSMDAGTFTAITGPSGSGKSTLMHLLGCLDAPDSGSYRLNGDIVSTLSPDRLADVRNRSIGFVFQSFHLLPRTTALENVMLPLLYRKREKELPSPRIRAMEALNRVGLGKRMDHVPSQLSGGQQQRVAIARALVTRPLLLLADEPTGNLDSKTTEEVMALFHELHRSGLTLVLVTHEKEVAAHARRVIEVRDGRIVKDEIQPSCIIPPVRELPVEEHP